MTDDRGKSMWYCPKCETWVGWRLDECANGHSRPFRPVRRVDVDNVPAWAVTWLDRVKALVGWYR